MKLRTKRLIALGLSAVMMFSLAACGKDAEKANTGANGDSNKQQTGTATPAPTKDPVTVGGDKTTTGRAEFDSEGHRIIKVGTWYDHYYTSDHDSIDDNPDVTDEELAQMQLDNMRAIEEKYNIRFQFVNLTWEGIMESINTSIMSGIPDCDIYECDLQFGVPAALSGYAMDIAKYAPADNDIFTDQTVLSYLNLMGAEENYLFKAVSKNNQLAGYPLGFNLDMIKEANLENPQDLYDRGEWTWDKFEEYLKVLTKDTDNDGNTDIYGFSGWWTTNLENLLMSNGASIASSPTEGLSSPATVECIDFLYRLYNEDKVAAPWNQDDWAINNQLYATKQACFFDFATWIVKEYGNTPDVGFEIGVVPWPIGPSGNQETNATIATAGNYYFIPNGVVDPELVFNVFYDWTNWFDGDTELRDDTEWAENMCVTERNYNYVLQVGQKEGFDLWGKLGVSDFSMVPIMTGEKTAAQYAEEFKLIFQDALDRFFQ